MSLALIISLDFSRSNARGRSDLHSPKTHGRPKRIASPEQCKIAPQRRRLSVRIGVPRLASQRPIAQGFAGPESDGVGRSAAV
jgi:hypothetical protein